ncbi:glycoside hydrolase family 3 protein [Spirochaeta lutea]|uniref:beta-glucosidase n=1 Tax=Spirochaeta lutea TaxID=1480694 RepID=A0A098QW96_9SPIO|nr:glycoside hydrolase family 3 N-terminal domain-containing protein [Spirochaeta lutea]KGE71979.1 hypothetical protein DC28_09330 [Spirochaeta lutea]
MIKKAFIAVSAVLIALALAACGGGDPFEVSIYSEQPEITTYQEYLEANPGIPSQGTEPILSAGNDKGVITSRGLEFKDSNGNGKLEPYEDWRLTPRDRAGDLVERMAVEEKLALLNWRSLNLGGEDEGFGIPGLGAGGETEEGTPAAQLAAGNRYALQAPVAPLDVLTYFNNVQGYVERLNWGIPMILSQDPTHDYWFGNEIPDYQYSTWPFMMGLGAINDLGLTKRFGEIVRDELRMSGYHVLLGPQADLATEPRWARIQHLLHADGDIVARHIEVLVKSMQGYDLDKNSVGVDGIITVLKHFPGAGSNQEGMDSHTRAGRYAAFPGGNLEEHLKPFEAAIEKAEVGAIMMAYSIIDPDQTGYEAVGSAYEYQIATELLKNQLGFDGTVVSDHSIATNAAWGVEDLSEPERLAKMLNAGTYQNMPGDNDGWWLTAYEDGLITDETINAAAIRTLELQFKLGLFENPYVNLAEAREFWNPEGKAMQDRMAKGFDAMRKAMVLTENPEVAPYIQLLPITATNPDYVSAVDTNGNNRVDVYFDSPFPDADSGQEKTYAFSSDSQYLEANFVDSIAEADIAIIRINARGGTYFGTQGGVPLDFQSPTRVFDHDSDQYTDETIPNYVDFGGWQFGDWSNGSGAGMVGQGYRSYLGYQESLAAITRAIQAKQANPDLKIILGMTASRPGIIEPFLKDVDGVFIDFAATDRAFLDVVFWQEGAAPKGTLPVEIPSSMESVRNQLEDIPGDTQDPTYEIGYGLEYNTGSGYGN